MFPYNILLNIKSGITPVKSRDSATLFLFNCRRWDYNTAFFLCPYGSKRLVILVFSVVFYRYDYCVTQNVKWRIFMLVCDYIVESIDGDYAHLRRTDLPEEELKLVARALLPGLRHLREIKITINRRNAGFFMSNFIYFYVVRSCILSLYVI